VGKFFFHDLRRKRSRGRAFFFPPKDSSLFSWKGGSNALFFCPGIGRENSYLCWEGASDGGTSFSGDIIFLGLFGGFMGGQEISLWPGGGPAFLFFSHEFHGT